MRLGRIVRILHTRQKPLSRKLYGIPHMLSCFSAYNQMKRTSSGHLQSSGAWCHLVGRYTSAYVNRPLWIQAVRTSSIMSLSWLLAADNWDWSLPLPLVQTMCYSKSMQWGRFCKAVSRINHLADSSNVCRLFCPACSPRGQHWLYRARGTWSRS